LTISASPHSRGGGASSGRWQPTPCGQTWAQQLNRPVLGRGSSTSRASQRQGCRRLPQQPCSQWHQHQRRGSQPAGQPSRRLLTQSCLRCWMVPHLASWLVKLVNWAAGGGSVSGGRKTGGGGF
jgi:hypothetical protein